MFLTTSMVTFFDRFRWAGKIWKPVTIGQSESLCEGVAPGSGLPERQNFHNETIINLARFERFKDSLNVGDLVYNRRYREWFVYAGAGVKLILDHRAYRPARFEFINWTDAWEAKIVSRYAWQPTERETRQRDKFIYRESLEIQPCRLQTVETGYNNRTAKPVFQVKFTE